MKDRYEIREVQTREELDAVVNVLWEAFYNPYRNEFNLLHPHYGEATMEARAHSIALNQERRWQDHKKNPGSHWMYLVDKSPENNHDGGEKIIGGVQWAIFTENPYPNGPVKLEATWLPQGELRDFASEFISQVLYPHMCFLQRPHMGCKQMGLLPAYRGKGLGDMLMQWGVRKADELNMECVLEASGLGQRLYASHGFKNIFSFVFNPWRRKDPSPLWRKLTAEYSPFSTIEIMWRPPGGILSPDGPQAPWEVK